MRNISVTNASNSASKDYYHTLVEGIILCSAFVVEAVLIAVGNLLTVVLFLMKFHGGGLGSITLQQQNRSAQNMKRLTKTLLFASMTAILSWLPLLIGNYLVADHEVYIPPHSYWLYVILMNYTNSIVNPVLYVLRISEFRSSLLLLCLRRPVVVGGEERGKQRDARSDLSAHALELETSKEEIMDTQF